MEKSTFRLNNSFFSFGGLIDKAFGVVSHIADYRKVKLVRIANSAREMEWFDNLYGDDTRFL